MLIRTNLVMSKDAVRCEDDSVQSKTKHTRNSAIADKPRDAFRGQSRWQTWYHSIC